MIGGIGDVGANPIQDSLHKVKCRRRRKRAGNSPDIGIIRLYEHLRAAKTITAWKDVSDTFN